jgi:two-component system sensor histidine kinase PhoQ
MSVASSRSYSLYSRLLLAFSLLLCVFLGLTGVVLDRAFRSSLEAGVAEQLQVQVYVLLAAVEEDDGEFYFGQDVQEPRYSQLNSGLYGFISSAGRGELLRTSSALERDFEEMAPDYDLARGDTRFQRVHRSGEEFFMHSYAVVWENQDEPFVFSVFESTSTYLTEVNRFRASLWSWLGGVVVLLLILQLLLLRWGLAPLRVLARDLKRIESGERELLQESYPRQLGMVTDNLNLLIQTERKQQARYRTTLADLAHSLKTPLAVIRGILERQGREMSLPDDIQSRMSQIEEQVDRMNQLVSYQLQRAVKSDETAPLARRVNVASAVDKVVRALEKVYADKQVSIQVSVEPDVLFMGDERDLLELIGNLLDNACKYGNGRVSVSASLSETPSRQLSIVVEDNGPGISTGDRERVLQRGVRLDTLEQGQGIGLAVVVDIVNSYGGQIEVSDTGSGGARVQLVFSNVQSSHA